MKQDSPWQDVVEELFEKFLLFFFPEIHCHIDFSKGFEFMDKELTKIIKDSATGKRIVDKLVKVYLFDGSEEWLLIHIEIQGYEQKTFPERMYTYNYRIFDKFRRAVISLALLTDTNPNFRPNEYNRSRLGCEAILRYPLVKIIDYRNRIDELEASANPFAIIVKAFLKTLETEGQVQERYKWKKRFLLEIYQQGMTRKTLLAIYRFIDWIMKLPKAFDEKLYQEMQIIKEAKAMPYITTAERIGRREGKKEGRKEGRKEGLEKGLEKGEKNGIKQSMPMIHQALALAIQAKFGESGQPLVKRASQTRNLKTLQKLMAALTHAQSLSEAQKAFAARNGQRH